MGAVVRPSERVAAARRRVFLWAPLLVAGFLVSMAGGPMIDKFNGLDVAGLAFLVAGVLGFIRELDR